MKKLLTILCAVFLIFGMAGVAASAPVWTDGVSTSGGWYDADKTWTDDTLLCWAASAANILAYTGWDGGPSLDDEDEILGDFRDYWNDAAGNPYFGVEWWFTGVNGRQGTAGWAQLTDTSHTGFYTAALFGANYIWDGTATSILTNLATYLTDDRGVSIRVGSTWGGGHFLTVWGYDPATDEIWVTDSDNGANSLDHYFLSGLDLLGSYTGWTITEVHGLALNSGGVDPIPREEPQVPEPATMLLLGSGLLGLAIFRRKE